LVERVDHVNPQGPNRARRAAPASRMAALLALPLLALQAWLVDPALRGADPLLIGLNTLPAALMFALLWLLGRRPLPALIAVAALVQGMHAVHQTKLLHTEQPLIPGDLGLLPQILRELPFYLRYVDSLWPLSLVMLLLLAALAARPWLPLAPTARAVAIAAMAVACTGLFRGWPPWNHIYSDRHLDLAPWSPRQSAEGVGMLAHFTWLSGNTQLALPAPDRALIARFEAVMDPAVAPVAAFPALPDIIIVQSESLFDPGRLRGLHGGDFLPNLRRIAANALSGDLRVPAYGGLTSRTEFEVLTGYPVRLFNTPYPYQGLVHRPIHALPRSTREAGYRNIAIHPYAAHFYRRNQVYPRLGFHSFLSVEDFADGDRHGYYVSDAALTERMLSLLDAADEPLLLFAVTMENHGPWDAERPIDPDAIAAIEIPEGLEPADALALRLYLHHLLRADQALGVLAAHVEKRDRATLVLFFGDHLPALHGVFATLGFADGRAPTEQPVPWLLFGNRPLPTGRMDLESHELAALVAGLAGVPDPYFERLALLRDAGASLASALDADLGLLRDQLALARYAEAAAAHPTRVPAGQGPLAEVVDWQPRSAESWRTSADVEALPETLWVRLDHIGPDQLLTLRIGQLTLRAQREEATLVAHLDLQQRRALFAHPAKLPVALIDRVSGASQQIGEIEVRARAARARLADGRTAHSLCPVEAWGPEGSGRDASGNLQPDGSLGLWFRAGCWPREPIVRFGDLELPGSLEDRLLTAAVPLEALRVPGPVAIGVLDRPTGEHLAVGMFSLWDVVPASHGTAASSPLPDVPDDLP
jgi:hypothetical protein